MSELHSRRREGALERDPMLASATAQFYQIRQGEQGDVEMATPDPRARSASLPVAGQHGAFPHVAMPLMHQQQQQIYLPASNGGGGGGGPAVPQVRSPHANKRD
jgi:hypothetical protein